MSGSVIASPAALSSPPTITRPGLITLQRPAIEIPISRPASPISRREAGSDAAISSSSRVRPTSSPRLPPTSAAIECAEATVSRHPALRTGRQRRRARRPADLAGRAARAPVEPAVEQEVGADAGGKLDVDQLGVAAAGAPDELGHGPEVGVVLHVCGEGQRRSISAAASTPTQPGRIDDEPTEPVARLIGPGSPMPTPITRPRSTPASARTCSTSSAAPSRPCSAEWSTSSSRPASARTACERSAAATRRWVWPKSTPSATPAEVFRASGTEGGRPAHRARRLSLRPARSPGRPPSGRRRWSRRSTARGRSPVPARPWKRCPSPEGRRRCGGG